MKNIIKKLKIIFLITKYSILMYFRDKTAIFFSLFIPILIMSIFGVINFGGSASITLGIADEAKNDFSKQVVEQVKKIEVFKIEEDSKETELEKVKRSETDMVMVIPKNFGTSSGAPTNIEVYADQSQNNTNQVGLTIIEKVFDQLSHQITKTPNLFAIEQKSVATTELTFVDFLIPGIAAMSVMNMGILGVIGAITSWRERGILKRLLATPITTDNIIFGQVATRLLISVGQVAVLVGLGILMFDLTIVGNIATVFLIASLGSIVFLSMGLAASAMAKTQNSVMAIGNLLTMPQMFLSGIFFPLETLPKWLSNVTQYLPLTFLADGMREVMIHGATIPQIRNDIFGLLIWGILCFVVAARFFNFE